MGFASLIPNAAAYYRHNSELQQSDEAQALLFAPDMLSTITRDSGNHAFSPLNILGYIPVLSTITGLYRTLVGLAYLIKSLACAIFDAPSRKLHVEGIKIAAANIGRGLLEMIPVIGNLFVINIDASRMMHRWSEHSGGSYGDRRTIPIFDAIDCISAIPVVGTVVSAVRILFFTIHMLVNLLPALSGEPRYCEALKFSAIQIGKGFATLIPLVGTAVMCCIHPPCRPYPYDDD